MIRLLFTCLALGPLVGGYVNPAFADNSTVEWQSIDHFTKIPNPKGPTDPNSEKIRTIALQDKHWVPKRVEEIKNQMKTSPCDILFLGDSLTEQFEKGLGKELWKTIWQPLKAINFGLSGDTTANLLWRIDDSKLKTITSPKVCVLLIGYNDIGRWEGQFPVQETLERTKLILDKIRQYCPDAQIILTTCFPYNGEPDTIFRKNADAWNEALRSIKDDHIHLLDISDDYLISDASRLRDNSFFVDSVHLSKKGYEKWNESLLPLVKKLMKKD